MAEEKTKRGKRFGKISEAYCFETDSVDGAFLACEKQASAKAGGARLHYFCTSDGCAYPMKGVAFARREDYDIAYFAAKPRGPDTPPDHVPGCPHIMGEIQRPSSQGVSRPPRYPVSLAPDLFIPEMVSDTAHSTTQVWPSGGAPSSLVLNTLIRNALGRPVMGSIEDVVLAERTMAKDYKDYIDSGRSLPRPEHLKLDKRLIISENETNYKDGIVPFFQAMTHLEEEGFWDEHIVWFSGRPNQDPANPDGFYLNALKGPMSVWIDTQVADVFRTKAYIRTLFKEQITQNGTIRCFWWKNSPLRSKKGNPYLRIKEAQDLHRMGFMSEPKIAEPGEATSL